MQCSARSSGQKRWARPVFSGAWLLLGVVVALYQPRLCVFADNDAGLKETSRKLAERVATIPGLHGPLHLEWQPDGKWSEGAAARWQEALRDAFDRRALQLSDEAGAPALVVAAAETPTQLVITAKTHVGDHDEVRIVAIPRTSLPPAELPVAPVRLERQLIYESPDRILDASSFSKGGENAYTVLLYKNFELSVLRVDPNGELKQTLPLNVAGLKPTRDPRGKISIHGSTVSVLLSGKSCEFSWDTSADAKCQTEKTPETPNSTSREDTVLTSPCDETNWTIPAASGEPTVREVLRLIPDGATPGSSATLTSEFPGPVLNLNAEQNPSSALLVVRNLRTGNYEVYKITLACGD